MFLRSEKFNYINDEPKKLTFGNILLGGIIFTIAQLNSINLAFANIVPGTNQPNLAQIPVPTFSESMSQMSVLPQTGPVISAPEDAYANPYQCVDCMNSPLEYNMGLPNIILDAPSREDINRIMDEFYEPLLTY